VPFVSEVRVRGAELYHELRKRALVQWASSAAFLGCPNVGKSTVFNALTATAPRRRRIIRSAPWSLWWRSGWSRTRGWTRSPSSRSRSRSSRRDSPSSTCCLVSGASRGEGLGNQFLAHVREVDAIAHVVRCFVDDDVGPRRGQDRSDRRHRHDRDRADAADLDSLEKRVDNLNKKAKGNDRDAQEAKTTLELVNRALMLLRDGKPARMVEAHARGRESVPHARPLTAIPMLYVCNVDEESAATGNEFSHRVEARGA